MNKSVTPHMMPTKEQSNLHYSLANNQIISTKTIPQKEQKNSFELRDKFQIKEGPNFSNLKEGNVLSKNSLDPVKLLILSR